MLNPISIAFKKAKQQNRPALLTYTVASDSSKKQSLLGDMKRVCAMATRLS